MRVTLLRLMLPFLLLSQVVVGMSPGHAICIALDACCGLHVHAESDGHALAGGGYHHHDHGGLGCSGHHDGHHVGHHDGHHVDDRFDDRFDDHVGHRSDHHAACPDDCANSCCAHEDACDGGCSEGSSHFHLALPDDGGCTRDRSNDHFCDLRLLAPALVVCAMQPVVDSDAQATPAAPWVWPDCDRARALETDCLLI
jgi:hypothetical protein